MLASHYFATFLPTSSRRVTHCLAGCYEIHERIGGASREIHESAPLTDEGSLIDRGRRRMQGVLELVESHLPLFHNMLQGNDLRSSTDVAK